MFMKGLKKTVQHRLTHAQTHILGNTTVLNQTKAQDFFNNISPEAR
jgi:hypothetical protein